MRLLRMVSTPPSRPATPMIPTTVLATVVESPMLSRSVHPSMVTDPFFTTTAASVAAAEVSRSPAVTVSRSNVQLWHSSKRRP